MSKQHLTETQLLNIQQLVKAGITPEEIAKKFGVAVSTIHYHKGRWKREGVSIPDIRGKRPGSFVERAAESIPNALRAITGQPFETKPFSSTQTIEFQEGAVYKFVVNGITVTIDKNAKSVEIHPDKIIVNF